eukprot:scaffold65088_cov36-Tisochrysis_lutea.AAC.2
MQAHGTGKATICSHGEDEPTASETRGVRAMAEARGCAHLYPAKRETLGAAISSPAAHAATHCSTKPMHGPASRGGC